MKRNIFVCIALVGISLSLRAIPPRPGITRAITLDDGTVVHTQVVGDGLGHVLTDGQGHYYVRTDKGNYQQVENADIRRAPKRIAAQTTQAAPRNIAPHGLVILVSFQDWEFHTPKEEIDSMLNARNYSRSYRGYNSTTGRTSTITAQGSAWKYFYDASAGQYDPVFDVVGPVTVSRNYAYYGKNVIQWGVESDGKPDEMIVEAVKLVDDSVDFSIYDNDHDGMVDFVYIFYAGYAESDGCDDGDNYIWPHNSHLSYTGKYPKVDNKTVDNYACSAELSCWDESHDGIGSFCHEFSHVLGLPDLYVTNSSSSHKTLGDWDIMDSGPYNNFGNTPPTYSSYERFFMGWLTPAFMPDYANVSLHDLLSCNCAIIMTASGTHNMVGNDPSPTTFYMLENRQKTGWDKYLPGHGMLITKVQYNYSKWVGNTVNNIKSSLGVDIIEADGNAPSLGRSGYSGKIGDAYPAGSDEFLELPEYELTYIDEYNGVISFRVNNGGAETVISDIQEIFLNTGSAKPYLLDGHIYINANGIVFDIYGNRVL